MSCATLSPNNVKYYNDHLTKSQFNIVLINSTINLLKILYPKLKFEKINLKFFIIEILRRSKTSIQSLQICSYYIYKLIKEQNLNDQLLDLPNCPKKLFLGLIIISSKFNQDHNYSFKSWLKICGCKEDELNLNLKTLKKIEVDCLKMLNYQLYINGLQYENWCNILMILGYDFIKLHKINQVNEITWESDDWLINVKLIKWCKFFININESNLKVVKIHFNTYYQNQLGKKIQTNLVSQSEKRKFDDLIDDYSVKRVHISCK